MDTGGARLTTWLGDGQILGFPEDYVQQLDRHPLDWVAAEVGRRGLLGDVVALEMDSYYFSPGLIQQLVMEEGSHPFLTLSLCDLYTEVGAWDEVVEAAAGIRNDDDVTLQVRLHQAWAFEQQEKNEAALEAYKDALRSKKRDPELLKEARYARAQLYPRTGKKAQGRKELEKLYAEDANYRDVAELLRGMG